MSLLDVPISATLFRYIMLCSKYVLVHLRKRNRKGSARGNSISFYYNLIDFQSLSWFFPSQLLSNDWNSTKYYKFDFRWENEFNITEEKVSVHIVTNGGRSFVTIGNEFFRMELIHIFYLVFEITLTEAFLISSSSYYQL